MLENISDFCQAIILSSKLSPLVLCPENGRLYQHLPAKRTLKLLMLPPISMQPLNQKKLFLHSGLSVRIIKDPKGHMGSEQTQAQVQKIKVMEMWQTSEQQP